MMNPGHSFRRGLFPFRRGLLSFRRGLLSFRRGLLSFRRGLCTEQVCEGLGDDTRRT